MPLCSSSNHILHPEPDSLPSGGCSLPAVLAASANAAGEAIDNMRWPEILGTIAGENTILMIVRSIEEVQTVIDRINTMIQR